MIKVRGLGLAGRARSPTGLGSAGQAPARVVELLRKKSSPKWESKHMYTLGDPKALIPGWGFRRLGNYSDKHV